MNFSHYWQEVRSSFWFVPALILLGAVLLASTLIAVDTNVELQFGLRWPLLFGAGAGGARGLLTAVASSMITVAGTVFSITIVALSLTSSQYTSRVLRNFMRDRTNQVVLGVFVGIFAYCLVVLRVIREGDEGAFVPSLAVLMALLLAFVGIGFLILFIHHIAVSIQASHIIAIAADETLAAVDHLFPEKIGVALEASPREIEIPLPVHLKNWIALPAMKTGYIESVEMDGLMKLAEKHQTVLKMERGIGEFVIEGTSLISLDSPATAGPDLVKSLNSHYVFSRYRSVEQDASFGIRQLVDIAMKALSPGINDTTTALMCLNYLTAILVRLASRDIPSPYRMCHGELRIIAQGPSFDSLVGEAFDQICQNASGNVTLVMHLLKSVHEIAGRVNCNARRESLRRQLAEIMEMAERTIFSTAAITQIKKLHDEVCRSL